MEESLTYLKEQFELPDVDVRSYSPLVLAYIGDGIYELVIRTAVVGQGNRQANALHKKTSTYVKASAQAAMMEAILEDLTEEELAVKAGYWHCFRYNPAAKAEGKDAFTLDSKAPTGEYQEFLNGEVRYNSLMRSNPEKAKKLFAKNEAEAKARYEYLNKLITLYGADKTEE